VRQVRIDDVARASLLELQRDLVAVIDVGSLFDRLGGRPGAVGIDRFANQPILVIVGVIDRFRGFRARQFVAGAGEFLDLRQPVLPKVIGEARNKKPVPALTRGRVEARRALGLDYCTKRTLGAEMIWKNRSCNWTS
jgi:hypothetical protein